ncbi:MAG: HAMP domain-containing protein [Lachnospiraceae bacterium]|nr:HAMP domain-containing protein [Lachnospiraceae bacterium]
MGKDYVNLKVEAKLKKAFTSILRMFIAAIFVPILASFLVVSSFSKFYSDAYTNTVAQLQIQRDIQMVGKLVLLSVTTQDSAEAAKYVNVASGKMEGISANVATLQEAFSDPDVTARLATEIDGLKAVIATLGEQITAQELAAAVNTFDTDFYSKSEAVNTILNEIGTTSDANALKEINISTYLAIGSIIAMIILGIINVLFATRISKALTNIIITPIKELRNAMSEMRQGNLDIKVEYQSQDEFGELAADFNQSTQILHVIVEDAGELLGEMAEGNFNINTRHEAQYVGSFRALIESMRKLNRQLDNTLRHINDVSEQVAVGSGQLADSSQALAEGATDQAASIEELSANIENVSNIAAGSAEGAQQAANQIADAAREAEKSREEINELTAAMERITETSREIENIIGAIEEIASQTNLLSLNASIEAARAGEAGRGFAVVADQIGKLAADSAQSAVTTRELIEKSLQEIEKGNEITQHTAETIGTVLASMTSFAGAATSSAEESRSQAELLKQVELGIEQISTVVQNNSASAEETSAVSEELSAQAESLKDLVGRFTLRE